jgi:hypothetical protein
MWPFLRRIVAIPLVDLDKEELTIFVPDPAPTLSEKKERARSQSPTKTKTLAPDTLEVTFDDYLWLRAEGMGDFQAVVGLTPQQATDEWLDECRAHAYQWPDWPLMMRSRALPQALQRCEAPGINRLPAGRRGGQPVRRPMASHADEMCRAAGQAGGEAVL